MMVLNLVQTPVKAILIYGPRDVILLCYLGKWGRNKITMLRSYEELKEASSR